MPAINGILMRGIVKSYPWTDHLSMVPIKGCECATLVLVNLSQLMPIGRLEWVHVCCAASQPLMVNYWALDLDFKVCFELQSKRGMGMP